MMTLISFLEFQAYLAFNSKGVSLFSFMHVFGELTKKMFIGGSMYFSMPSHLMIKALSVSNAMSNEDKNVYSLKSYKLNLVMFK